jgi:hypothetical protein
MIEPKKQRRLSLEARLFANGGIVKEMTLECRSDEPAVPETEMELLNADELDAVGGGAFPFIQQ